MREVGADDPSPSKVSAINGLAIFPLAISAAGNGCTFGGVSQEQETNVGRGVSGLLSSFPPTSLQPAIINKVGKHNSVATAERALYGR